MGNAPAVSVVIATYNRAHYIAETLDSVLGQTFRDFEVILVDDGSTDNTREIVARYESRVHYVHQGNRGPSAARQPGPAAIESSPGRPTPPTMHPLPVCSKKH